MRDALRQRRARHRQHLQRTADHQRVGGRGVQGSEGRGPRRPASCRTATARRRCSNTCGRGSISTKSISRASTIATTASSADGSQPILDTIRRLHAMGFWVEIVTLLIPGFNDSRDELKRLTAFVASVSPDIPWHVTAFHGDYKMTDAAEHDRRHAARRRRHRPRAAGCATSTPATCPGQVGDLEDTRCATCGETADRALRLPHPRATASPPTAAARRARRRCPAAGASGSTARCLAAVLPGARGLEFRILSSEF